MDERRGGLHDEYEGHTRIGYYTTNVFLHIPYTVCLVKLV